MEVCVSVCHHTKPPSRCPGHTYLGGRNGILRKISLVLKGSREVLCCTDPGAQEANTLVCSMPLYTNLIDDIKSLQLVLGTPCDPTKTLS